MISGALAVATFVSHYKLFANLPKMCKIYDGAREYSHGAGVYISILILISALLFFPISKSTLLLHKAFCAPHICPCCQLFVYQVWGGGRNMRCVNNRQVLLIQSFITRGSDVWLIEPIIHFLMQHFSFSKCWLDSALLGWLVLQLHGNLLGRL